MPLRAMRWVMPRPTRQVVLLRLGQALSSSNRVSSICLSSAGVDGGAAQFWHLFSLGRDGILRVVFGRTRRELAAFLMSAEEVELGSHDVPGADQGVKSAPASRGSLTLRDRKSVV